MLVHAVKPKTFRLDKIGNISRNATNFQRVRLTTRAISAFLMASRVQEITDDIWFMVYVGL